jgi:hypothetical protein
MDAFFAEIAAGRVKVRIMFRQNARKPRSLSPLQVDQAFFKLYYQFIKHAFGFAYMPPADTPRFLRAYFDQLPDTKEQVAQFRGYILALNRSREFAASHLTIREQDFTEVRSHEHVLLQCVDIVLGSMAFRLNNKHLEKPPGARKRGKRTIAKESLYKHILAHIRSVRPGFNIGISTGATRPQRWSAPYLHWSFEPADGEFDSSLTKK